MKIKLQRITLACPDEKKDKEILTQLYEILLKINPQKSKEDIRDYYFKQQLPEIMNIVLIFVQNTCAGFYSVTAYTYKAGKKSFRVLRTAIGLQEQFRGRRISPTARLCSEFIKYKIRHPFISVVGVFFVENPLVYAMVSKRVKHLYPNRSLLEPDSIQLIRKDVLRVHNVQDIENNLTLRIYFKVFFPEADLKRIEQSEDENVRFYVKMNPAYADGYSLLTILPVTWQNIVFCLRFIIVEKTRKAYFRFCGN